MKIILDTNVIISSLITKGVCYEVVKYIKKRHSVFISNFIIKELKEKLKNKFKYDEKEIKEVLFFLSAYFINMGNVRITEEKCKDIDDNNILSLAIKVKADIIITGDKELLEIKVHNFVKILKPADFWRYEFEKIFQP